MGTLTTENLQAQGLQFGADGVWRLPLKTLREWVWDNNPKTHQNDKISYSITKFGMNDDIGVDPFLKFVAEGHGRIENLSAMQAAGQNPPKNVYLGEDGDWWVGVKPLAFDSRAEAMRYALWHNLANTHKAQSSDYRPEKLAAIEAAQPGLFDTLLGDEFKNTVAPDGGRENIVELPEPTKQEEPVEFFDPGKFEDRPATQVSKSLLIMVAFRTREELNSALSLLSIGERRQTLPEGQYYASFNGSAFLPRWQEFIGPHVSEANGGAAEVVAEANSAWDEEGFCRECGGAGHSGYSTGPDGGRTPITCSACGGTGNREDYNRKTALGANVSEILEAEEVTGVEGE